MASGCSMMLTAAITGNLHKWIVDQRAAAEKAVTEGIREITTQIKNDLRAQVVSAGLGNRLAKTWQAKVYPRVQKSISAAGVVKSKASSIIRAFNDGALIKSSKGLFLAIPTDSAPKRGTGNKRISPSTFPESRGKLRFIYVNSRMSVLVADSKTKHKPATVMFILVPQVQLKKRLDYISVVDKLVPQLPQTILANWPDETSSN
jgi:Family of unknown function (DUF6441)